MHVRFSYQSEPSTLPGISRNKPRSKPWPQLPAANSLVNLGRVTDGPPNMVGQSASSRPNQQSLWTFSSFSKFVRRTVRLFHVDGPRFISSLYTETHRDHVFTLKLSAVDRWTVCRLVRRSGPDGPLPPSGWSVFTCLNTLALAHEQSTYVRYNQPPLL